MEKLSVALGKSKTLEYLDLSTTKTPNLHLALWGLAENTSLRTLLLNNTYLKTQALLSIA
jgi:hypothetical protein